MGFRAGGVARSALLEIIEQGLPGERVVTEEEAEKRGPPDAWKDEPDVDRV